MSVVAERNAGASSCGCTASRWRDFRVFLRGRIGSDNWVVACKGRLDCGVFENMGRLSASAAPGAGKVIARLARAAAFALALLPALAPLLAASGASGRTTCCTT